jgi:hypothetical protein
MATVMPVCVAANAPSRPPVQEDAQTKPKGVDQQRNPWDLTDAR